MFENRNYNMSRGVYLSILIVLLCPLALEAQPIGSTNLEDVAPSDGIYRRVLGSVGSGASGVPVAGGFDVDKDGKNDYAMAAMRAAPQGRNRAGQVFLVLGDNTISGLVDTALDDPSVLEIHGDQVQENAGSEIWMADVTGNGYGYGDLIICRQNYSPDENRIGAGALTLIPANPLLRTMAAEGTVLDLRNPPENLPILNIVGAMAGSRLCIWARNGDVTGDGIDDLAIGADQEQTNGNTHAGAVYLVRGGDWLLTAADIDLADFGTVAAGNIARIKPRAIAGDDNPDEYHFGATLQLADLDGNSKAEVIAAAALNRSGAAQQPVGGIAHSSGGTDNGTLYIAWDDNFTGNWIPAPDFVIDQGAGSYSIISGGSNSESSPGPDNDAFGEEILGGLDYDNNGSIDLFVGDLTADGYQSEIRNNAGLAHVIYDAEDSLRNTEIELDTPPEGFAMATFLGPKSSAIAGDTALHGDFNDDGIADLAVSSPMDSPSGVINAGTLHIVLGKTGKWPVFSDLQPGNFPSSADVQIHEIYGGSGLGGSGGGDVLCYSAASGDMNNDGVIDLIVNEMQGDGSSTVDAGNLLIINSRMIFGEKALFKDGFE
jgi:hypothetical protein